MPARNTFKACARCDPGFSVSVPPWDTKECQNLKTMTCNTGLLWEMHTQQPWRQLYAVYAIKWRQLAGSRCDASITYSLSFFPMPPKKGACNEVTNVKRNWQAIPVCLPGFREYVRARKVYRYDNKQMHYRCILALAQQCIHPWHASRTLDTNPVPEAHIGKHGLLHGRHF